jgi:hypothetical protein
MRVLAEAMRRPPCEDNINPLTLELNPTAQRCLTRYFTGNFASSTVHFVNICVKTQQIQQPFTGSVYQLCMVAPTCFGITFPSPRNVPRALWEMLNWGPVDRILWMGVLCLVTWCVAIWDRCSSIEHLSEGTRNAPWRWQCNAETCRIYHT